MPKPSLPVRLVLLVAGTTLPLIVFAVGIVFHNYRAGPAGRHRSAYCETVRSIRLVLDSEVQRMTGGLQVLALTDTLRNGDFEGFAASRSASSSNTARTASCWSPTATADMLFSSTTSDTASLPPRNNRDIVEQVFATKRPQYSNLFVGAVKQRLIVTVEVPVFRDGEVIYDISFSPPIEMFQAPDRKAAAERGLDDLDASTATASMFARVPNPQDSVGKRASPSLYADDAAASRGDAADGVARRRAADHRALRDLTLTGWIVAAGIAESSLVAPLWRNLAITSVIGAVLLLIGLAFAVRMATTIARGEMLHDLLIEELNHRVKNTLAILQAIAVQTFRSASTAEREKFEGRLGALAEAHNLLSQEKWQGSELAGRGQPRAAALSARTIPSGSDVRPAGAAVAAPCGGAVDDRARDRHQRREIRRAVQRQRQCRRWTGKSLEDDGKPKTAADLDRDRRPAGRRARAARLRLAPDRAQRARPARRRGHRRLSAARRRLHRDLRAGDAG